MRRLLRLFVGLPVLLLASRAAFAAPPDQPIDVRPQSERWAPRPYDASPAGTVEETVCFSSCCDPCRRRVSGELVLGMWTTMMDGDATVRGNDLDVDVGFDELIDMVPNLESTFTGALSVSVDRWWFGIAGYYLRLGEDTDLEGGGRLDVTLESTIIQAAVGYEVLSRPFGCSPCTCFRLTPYVGVRYTSMELDAEIPGAAEIDGEKEWWDPFVGVRADWDFGNRWALSLSADVGGFGVGSDFTWSAMAMVTYKFSEHVGLRAGWIFLDYDYSDGSGADEFSWDVLQHGPFLGLVIYF
jgi:hypothetical protein